MTADIDRRKDWITLRARACRLGILTFRSDPEDGTPCYFSVRHAVPRQHADLAALEQYVWAAEEQRRADA